MSISRVKNWATGEVLTANDLNNEFNNITNNVLLEPFVATQQVDMNGQLLILDADADTYLDASTDDVVDVTIAGADDFRFAANLLTALSGSAITLTAGNVNMTSGDVAFTSGRVLHAKAGDVASTASITVPTTGNVFDLTGTTTITSFSTTQAGTTYRVRYTGAGLNLIYNATSLITPYAKDYRLATNEVFDLVSLGSGNYYIVPVSGAPGLEPGTPFNWWGTTAPTGGLLMDYTAVNCTTYHGLARVLIPNASTLGNSGTSVGAFTAAADDIITLAGHGLAVNDIIHVTTSAADLPLGLTINTVYFVKTVPDVDTLTVSTTRGGSTLDIQDAGTGTHTLHNKINIPDMRGRVWMGLDNLGGSAASIVTSASTNGSLSTTLGGKGGTETHTLTLGESAANSFTINIRNNAVVNGGGVSIVGSADAANDTLQTATEGGGGAHSNTPPWMAGGMAIRY